MKPVDHTPKQFSVYIDMMMYFMSQEESRNKKVIDSSSSWLATIQPPAIWGAAQM
jgi:hypothetical protein